MTVIRYQFSGPTLELFAAAGAAIAQIPPAFPLEATVAVNPYLGQIQLNRAEAAARLARVGAGPLTPPRSTFAQALDAGRITDADLAATGLPPATLRAAARAPDVQPHVLPTLADLAARVTGRDWPALVIDRIGAWAGAQFDTGQAMWPVAPAAPFAAWRSHAMHDLSPALCGLRGMSSLAGSLLDHPHAAFAEVCARLDVTPDLAAPYFHRLMVDLGGWGQVARGKGWLAERDGGHDDTALALLTVRLVWEVALLDHMGADGADVWERARAEHAAPLHVSDDVRHDLALQEAADRAAERRLAATLSGSALARRGDRPGIQAAFCIDVRSEIFRRALESTAPGIRTIGFAGFFGLAAAHRAEASDLIEARGPVLLSPGVASHAGGKDDCATRIARRTRRAWGRFRAAAVSAFAFVEAAGPLYAAKLTQNALAMTNAAKPDPAPTVDLPLKERVAAAARILRAMSLTGDFARLVLIAGHGAHVTNAPHASALQCGACGGHAGDVNARLLAGLLNDTDVRLALVAEGIAIPDDTHFVAGLHDTVSDRVTLFDDRPAPTHADDLTALRQALARAATVARTERAARLPRADAPDSLARRGDDWSELRPEWGLAGCNAFVAAPRDRTTGKDLGGTTFLHTYDWRTDEGFGVLELILTAPVVVASWISLQYHGSSVAPATFGGGNKLLHNVVGGIGVIEGTHGPLRTGLPWQSVHDGDAFRHTAQRLAVVIEAPSVAILDVLDRHDDLKALFDNGWLSLHRMDDTGRMAERYRDGIFVAAGTGEDLAEAA